MKVSYNWLKEYVDIDIDVYKMTEKLSLAGLVTEGIEKVEDDFIIEFERLPNRPDWLNVYGIAREISAVFNVQLKTPEIVFEESEEKSSDYIDINIEDENLCNRYCGKVIKNIKVCESPSWLKDRLEASGIRAINNIVDITNYVLLEYGHPLHAFDYDLLSGKKIIVRCAKDGEKINSLDGVSRKLEQDMLVIADAEKPIAIAGVMGGSNSEVSDKTVTILLESAYFNPANVRSTSKKLGLSTEASYRFERGADIDIVKKAENRTAQLVAEIAQGEILKEVVDIYPKKLNSISLEVRTSVISSIIGVTFSDEEIEKYLISLGFSVCREENNILIVDVPNFRREVYRVCDIAEEIARIYGYDKIPETMPFMKMAYLDEHPMEILTAKIKDRITGLGFNEVINYSFISPKEHTGYNQEKTITLSHPLADTQSEMRQHLISGLIRNMVLNNNYGNTKCDIFEVGKVYSQDKEEYCLGILARDEFLELKGTVISLLEFLGYKGRIDIKSDENLWCSTVCCSILIDNQDIGFIGILSDKNKKEYDFKDEKNKVCICQLNLDKLILFFSEGKKYKKLSRFPSSKRDFALVMQETISYQEVVDFIDSISKPFLCNISLFDIYKGAQVEKGYKSLAFALEFKDENRTLTDEEVNKSFEEIIEKLKIEKGICLR